MSDQNASPEKIFIDDLWFVIRKIKEKSLRSKYGEDIKYPITLGSVGRPYNDDEEAMLKKLEEWKILALTKPHGVTSDGQKTFVFETQYPKFTDLYTLCKNATEKNIAPERLLRLVKEFAHPIGMDMDLTYELWELSKVVPEKGARTLRSLVSRSLPHIGKLYNFSAENRSRIKRFIELILNQVELQGHRSLGLYGEKPLTLPGEMLIREGFSIPEAELLIEQLDKVADHSFIKKAEQHRYTLAADMFGNSEPTSEKLNVSISSPSALRDIKENLEAFEKRLAQQKPETATPETPKKPAAQNEQSEEDQDVIFRVIFHPEFREVVLNEEYVLSTPNFSSENYNFIEYAAQRSGIKITKSELESVYKQPLVKSFHQTINDLGFTGPLRKMFFPSVSKEAVFFRSGISEKEFMAMKVSQKNLKASLKKLKPYKK